MVSVKVGPQTKWAQGFPLIVSRRECLLGWKTRGVTKCQGLGSPYLHGKRVDRDRLAANKGVTETLRWSVEGVVTQRVNKGRLCSVTITVRFDPGQGVVLEWLDNSVGCFSADGVTPAFGFRHASSKCRNWKNFFKCRRGSPRTLRPRKSNLWV